MRFLWVFFLLLLLPFLVSAESVILTQEQWRAFKAELVILREYYEKNESLLSEREAEYSTRQSEYEKRLQQLNERESALNEREIDLQLRESFQESRERLLTESTILLERSRRETLAFKILSIIGGAGTLSGWLAFGLK